MLEVQHVAFNILPKAIGILEGTMMILRVKENCNKEAILNNLEQLAQLMQQSRDTLEKPALSSKNNI